MAQKPRHCHSHRYAGQPRARGSEGSQPVLGPILRHCWTGPTENDL